MEAISKDTIAAVIATPLADYPYRIAITNEHFVNWMAKQSQSIHYKNFKYEVGATRGYGFAHS